MASNFLLIVLLLCISHLSGIRRVAIIGGGPAGLSLSACLKRLNSLPFQEGSLSSSITIFERRQEFLNPELGGGIQISGGAVVLHKIGIFEEFQNVAERIDYILSRNKDRQVLFELDVNAVVKRLVPTSLNHLQFFSIMRASLLSLLFNITVNESGTGKVDIITDKKCIGVQEVRSLTGNNTVSLSFEDGSVESGFDLVVDASGVGSPGLEQWNNTRPSKRRGEPLYSFFLPHLRVAYGVTDADSAFELRPEAGSRGAFHQWFGRGCYALVASYGCYCERGHRGGVKHMIAVVYAGELQAEASLNPDWDNGAGVLSAGNANGLLDLKTQVRGLLESSGLLAVTELRRVFDAAPTDRFIDVGVTHRPLPRLPWISSSGRVILLGDSAHAMPPFLGQGANQALQDAYFIAQGIRDINGMGITDARLEEFALQLLGWRFVLKRFPPVAILTLKSTVLGVIETLPGLAGSAFRDSFFRFMSFVGVVERSFVDAAIPKL